MPLPLPRLPGVLPHVEWLALALYQPELGGMDQNNEGTPQPPPQVQALQEPSISRETKHPSIHIGEMQAGRGKASQMQDLATLLQGKKGIVSDKYIDTNTIGGFYILRADNRLQ